MVGGRLVVVMQVRRCRGYTVLRYLGPSGRKCLTMLFRKFARVYRLEAECSLCTETERL